MVSKIMDSTSYLIDCQEVSKVLNRQLKRNSYFADYEYDLKVLEEEKNYLPFLSVPEYNFPEKMPSRR